MAASFLQAVRSRLATDATIPVPFLDVVPAGQEPNTPGLNQLPAVVIEDNGAGGMFSKYMTSSTLPYDCQHGIRIKVYAIETSVLETATLDLAKKIADVLTPSSLTISGSSNPRIFRGDGFLQLAQVKQPDYEGKTVYLCTMPYIGVYQPPW